MRRPPPEPWSSRIRSALGLSALAVLIASSLAVYLWHLSRGEGVDATAIEVCRAAYAQAHNAADSASVDAQTPITSRRQASVAVSCSTFKASGRFQ
jgi:hypothetical protein